MHTSAQAQAQVLRALRAGSRVTLKLQTGQMQQILRAMAARGMVSIDGAGVVSVTQAVPPEVPHGLSSSVST